MGKPRVSMWSTIGASIMHIWIAPYFAVTLNMKMAGLSIATAIHFFLRTVINFCSCYSNELVSQAMTSPFQVSCWKEWGYIF